MKFSRDKIRNYVNSLHINDDVDIVEVKYFNDPKNKKALEDKAVQLIVLAAKTPGTAVLSRPSQYNSNKKFAAYNKNYHRYFLCADASNPPHCFGLVTNTMSQTHQLLCNSVDESFLGQSFYLVEPNISTAKMGKYLPVLSCEDSTLIPLKAEESSLDKRSDIEIPTGTEETFYFVLRNKPIAVSRIKAPHDVSCTGFQCDRQKKKGECVCIQFAPGFPLVYSFDIEFDVDPKVMNGETKHVSNFRSFRTTQVFFRNFLEYSSTTTFDRERNMQRKRRQQMSQMVEFVNANGGWTIVGWCKKGEVSIEGENEKVENNDVNLNLSYVYPTNRSVFNDENFKALQIYDDFNELSPATTGDSVFGSNQAPNTANATAGSTMIGTNATTAAAGAAARTANATTPTQTTTQSTRRRTR